MKKDHIHSLRAQTIFICGFLILSTWTLMTYLLFSEQIKNTKATMDQNLNLTADKKTQELNNTFVLMENAVSSAKNYIMRTIDEKRILRDPAYEAQYMKDLTEEMVSLASLTQDVITLYFRMNIDKYGPTTGIFLESTRNGYVSVKPTNLSQYSPTDTEHTGWYYIPVWKKAPVWTPPYFNKNINIHMISYIIPMYKNGELLGIVGMDVNMATIKEIVSSLPSETEQALLLGQEKNLLYETNAIQKNSVEQSANISAIFDRFENLEAESIQMFNWNKEAHYGVKRNLENDMTLIIAVSQSSISQARKKLFRPVLLTFVIVLLLTGVLLAIALRRIIYPIRIITNATFRLSRGELNITIPYKSKNELGKLTDNIRMMTSQMQDYIVHIQEQAKKERQAKESALAASQSKSKFLASMYLSLHEIDLNEDVFAEITCQKDIAENIGESCNNARATVRRVMEDQVKNQGQSRADFMEFINFNTLDERMKDRITIAHEFLSIRGIWCRARFILMDRNEDGTLHHVLWAVEDINDERAERERLEGEIAKTMAASQAKSSFLANMSHEIRTPINAVLGMDEMILRECEDPAILNYAANIKSASSSLLSIVNDILDFSKIEAGKMELLPENYDISSLVVDLVNMIQDRAKKKNLNFELQTEPTLPRSLYGDSIRIKQCILNLLTNAVKYTNKGTITFSLGYHKIDESRIFLHVSVEDTGTGIKMEDMEKLFSPFERIEEIKNKTIEGTGLGMSIVKKILALMKSRLEVKSEYGKGSLFAFQIEQQVVDWTPVGDINENYLASISQMYNYHEKLHAPNAHLLFVDDTEMNLEVIKGLLKKTEIKIDTALSGREALNLVQKNTYDILFIDHRMPEMDGIETLHAMKDLKNNLCASKPCVALTANAIAGVKQMYLNEGFNDYLSKPVNPEKLEDTIRKYLPPEKLEDWLEAVDEPEKPKENPFIEQLKDLKALDIEQAVANCGSAGLFESTIKKYFESIDGTKDELENFLAVKDILNYGTKVHSLKSTSRLIGAMSLSQEAAYLEEKADEKDISEIQEKHPLLMEKLMDLKKQLEEVFTRNKSEENEDKPLLEGKELTEKLKKMAVCADNFDIDGLDSIMAELRASKLPEDFEEIFGKISACVDNIDYKSLKSVLKSYNKTI